MKKLILIFTLTLSLPVWAADPAPTKAKPKGSPTQNAPRKKEIDFEERVIEGMSGRGYESLSQTGNVDDPSKDKLYKKRAEFDEESKYLLREMEYLK